MSSALETEMGLKCQNGQAEVALQCGEQWKEVGKTVRGVFDPGRERSSRSEPTGIIVIKSFLDRKKGSQVSGGVEVQGGPSGQRRMHGWMCIAGPLPPPPEAIMSPQTFSAVCHLSLLQTGSARLAVLRVPVCRGTICPQKHMDKPQGHPEPIWTQLDLAACSFPTSQDEWRSELRIWVLSDWGEWADCLGLWVRCINANAAGSRTASLPSRPSLSFPKLRHVSNLL